MNLLTKQKETQQVSLWLLGEGVVREFGMVMCTLLYLEWASCIVHGTLLSVGWERCLGENGYMCMYG